MSLVSSSHLRRLRGLALAVLLTSVAGCSSDPTEHSGDEFSLEVGLINGDVLLGQPIHLFGPGETFPCCRVDPLSTREIFKTVKVGDKLTFQAGRSGSILKSVQCTVNNTAGKIVKWTPSSTGSDNGTLSCHTGW